MIPILMPQVGQDIPTAKIIEWRKGENDPVEKGEVILVVESEKAAFEVEAEESGVLLKILHGEGEEVEVFKPLAYIGQRGETSVGDDKVRVQDALVEQANRLRQEVDAEGAVPVTKVDSDRVVASPSARRAAREFGVDLRTVAGSGPGKRITKKDVLAASVSPGVGNIAEKERSQSISSEGTVLPFDKMRKRIADRLARSKQTVPHFYLVVDVDMTETLKWGERFNSERGTKITVTDLIIRACALALRKFPRMNSHVDSDRVVLKRAVNIGVATVVEKGLLVPVIPDADRKSLVEISELSKKNAEAARRGFLHASSVGTFTLSTLGMYSIREFLPIINAPECGILGVGSIEKRVAPHDDAVVVRDMMILTLACDHRAVDGVYAAQFLNQVKQYLVKGCSEESESST